MISIAYSQSWGCRVIPEFMSLISLLPRLRILPERILLQLFPPFLFMGVKVREVSRDYRVVELTLPLRWYGKNVYGTMFGGFIAAFSDPIPLLMCEKIFPGAQAWTSHHEIDFLKPGRTALDLRVEVTEAEVNAIRAQLDASGEATHTFRYLVKDQRKRDIARISNTVFMRYRKRISS